MIVSFLDQIIEVLIGTCTIYVVTIAQAVKHEQFNAHGQQPSSCYVIRLVVALLSL